MKIFDFDSDSTKRNYKKMCIFESDNICDNCCQCFICDLDPEKTCDNCAKCLEISDYNEFFKIADAAMNKKCFLLSTEEK